MSNSTLALDYVAQIGTNPWLTVLGFIVAIIGIALTIIFYFKSKRVKSPCYAIKSYNIIKDFVSKFEALEMRYGGQIIKNLTVSKIVFWNAGSETIDKEDIVKADPITINIKDGYKILDQKIIATNNETNNFSLSGSIDQSNVNINFEYIDKNDGIVVQLIHTGNFDKDIKVQGRIKGAGNLKYIDLKIIPSRLQAFEGLIGAIALILPFSLIFILIHYILSSILPLNFRFHIELFGTILIGTFIIVKGERYMTKRFSKLPKGLELFSENYIMHNDMGKNK